MRGKVSLPRLAKGGIGITPAYAGKSFSNVTGFFKEQDHPRLCGEKYAQKEFFYKNLGSPPPMRGKVAAFFEPIASLGITPAYAGKSGMH